MRDSGRLISLAFRDSIRLAEEVEFTLHRIGELSAAHFSEGNLVWGCYSYTVLGRAYRRPCIRLFSEYNTSSISSYICGTSI
jgi:hypothetical protein